MKSAVLVDGGFFVKRYVSAWRKATRSTSYPSPDSVVDFLHESTLRSISSANRHLDGKKELYRILFYDCPPSDGGSLSPISKQYGDYSRSDTAVFRKEIHEQLKRKRKVALRLGRLSDKPAWIVNPAKTNQILKDPSNFLAIQADDIHLDLRQKGVDMKIGLDIASLSFKRQVDQIILVSGDSDFVPAAKLARREGIDFVLDSMGNHINPDLHEHIDGLLVSSPDFQQADGTPQ